MSEIINPIIFDDTIKDNDFIYFEVPGEPFAKQRPRAARKGRYVTIYTPRETKEYESKVVSYYNRTYRGKELKGNLEATIEAIFSVPKTAKKSEIEDMQDGITPHNKKPDVDNVAKVCLDALNGVAFEDDSSISSLMINKRFGKNPMAKIFIKENNKNGRDK
jgi:Holliday junction resolvase RusA-like endonuclease